MVLLVSSESDQSTSNVIMYLLRDKKKYFRLGEAQSIYGLSVNLQDETENSIEIEAGGMKIDLKDITSLWFRKRGIDLFGMFDVDYQTNNKELNIHLKKNIKQSELKTVQEYIYYKLNNKPHLGNYKIGDANKLISFEIAKECGLQIPSTIVSSAMKNLQNFEANHTPIMSKAIQDVFDHVDQPTNTYYGSLNKLVKNLQDEKDERIFPSALQAYVDKQVELRIFYLKGKFYSMAIFSQSNKKTKIDFRNYDDDKPNRCVPYNLPKSIEDKLRLFMSRVELFTGSIDMILTNNDEYVFLEVNPVGQYGMVSVPCNYHLDELIANELI